MAEENRNQELLDDFKRWQEKVFNHYVRVFDRANDDNNKFLDDVRKFETDLEEDSKQPKLVVANKSKFEDLKDQQGELQNRLTLFRDALVKATTGDREKD
jgi:hypothetical protein